MSTHARDQAPVTLKEEDRAPVIAGRTEEVAATVFLQPIAAPSILGLYGFAGATFMVTANLAGWYGSPNTAHYLFPFGYWFIVLAVITWTGTWIATTKSWALTSVLGFLAAGSTAIAIGQLIGSPPWVAFAGWLFIISAIIAWYTATALLAESSFGRPILPLFASANAARAPAFVPGIGEPGVRHGQ